MEIPTNKPDKYLQYFTLGIAIIAIVLSSAAIMEYGTTQSVLGDGKTCDETLCGDSIQIRTISNNIDPTQLFEGNVPCNEGEVITGGGVKIEDDPKLFVWKNAPSLNRNAWSVSVTNHGTVRRLITAYAVCIKVK